MELKVIKGGKALDNDLVFSYEKGWVTDTRLMGVLGLHLVWKQSIENMPKELKLHQFFYYDIEELGLDSIKLLYLSDETAIANAEKSAFGGLGAKMIEISEAEARFLVNTFVEETKRKKQTLPPEISEIKFITSIQSELNNEEIAVLNKKMCVDIANDYGVINYYLMRCFGKDQEGAKLLLSTEAKSEDIKDVSSIKHSTFLLNNTELFTDKEGKTSYLAESLTESENGYQISVNELIIKDKKVLSVKQNSKIDINPMEVSLLLNKCEFVSLYEIIKPMEEFDTAFAGYSIGFTKTEHESGQLFMEFKANNKHAENKNFRLADDINAIYYVSDYGQLIVSAYSLIDVLTIEKRLEFSPLNECIIVSGRYQFPQSLVYEFVLSGFTDFAEFLDSLT